MKKVKLSAYKIRQLAEAGTQKKGMVERRDGGDRWQPLKRCGNVRLQAADISTILIRETGKERFQRELILRICPRIGNVRSAARVKRCLNHLLGLVRQQKGAKRKKIFSARELEIIMVTIQVV